MFGWVKECLLVPVGLFELRFVFSSLFLAGRRLDPGLGYSSGGGPRPRGGVHPLLWPLCRVSPRPFIQGVNTLG